MKKYAVIGTGSAPASAVTECLRDLLTPDDIVLIGWVGSPIPESVETVYGYLLDNEMSFALYHRPEQTVPKAFRESDECVVTQSRHPVDAMLKEADEVLFLWDDAENDATPSLIQYVMDHISEGVMVKELSNGLAPIVIDYEMPEPEPAPVEEDEDDDDTSFTRDELEIMTAAAVKRYGERRGCKAKTKAGIIEELFDESEWEPYVDKAPVQETSVEEPAVESPAPQASRSNPSFDQELIALIGNFYEHYKPGFEYDMASLLLGQARLWMLKALSS